MVCLSEGGTLLITHIEVSEKTAEETKRCALNSFGNFMNKTPKTRSCENSESLTEVMSLESASGGFVDKFENERKSKAL